MSETAESRRVEEEARSRVPWKKWGPYLSERQWGTVREDYSDNGDAWSYFSHDQARSRAYRWGEDDYGDAFRIECPTGSGRLLTLFEVARELASRLAAVFLRDEAGRRPVFGGTERFQTDPHWRDHLLFYEYFHGDNGTGLGASHQTGWTGIVAKLIQLFGTLTPDELLRGGSTHPIMSVYRRGAAGR